MTTQDLWKVWHECKGRIAHAPGHIHENFDEDWNDEMMKMLSPGQREDVAMFMKDMAENYETYERLHGEPGVD